MKILFFAQLREIVGASSLERELPAGASVGDLLELLYREHPRLREWDGSILVGAGVEFVERDYHPQPGEEIAIMPPVQGG